MLPVMRMGGISNAIMVGLCRWLSIAHEGREDEGMTEVGGVEEHTRIKRFIYLISSMLVVHSEARFTNENWI